MHARPAAYAAAVPVRVLASSRIEIDHIDDMRVLAWTTDRSAGWPPCSAVDDAVYVCVHVCTFWSESRSPASMWDACAGLGYDRAGVSASAS